MVVRTLQIVLEVKGNTDVIDFESIHMTLEEFIADQVRAWGSKDLVYEIKSIDDDLGE